jgi:2'-5' RNA ligase
MRSVLFFVFSALFLAANSANALISLYLPSPDYLSAVSFQANANYLVQNIRFEPVNELKLGIESELHIKLIDRGEAHITVISPPEFTDIQNHISISEINAFAQEKQLQTMPFKAVCVGSRAATINGSVEQTFYAVVRSPALVEFRRLIYEAAKAKGYAGSGFNPHVYYPHITIGYKHRDLHAQDGAIKDTSSCVWYFFR